MPDVVANAPRIIGDLQLWAAKDGRLRITTEVDGAWQTASENFGERGEIRRDAVEFLGATWRKLGDAMGLTDFGVNLVRLPPGKWSSQRHWHTHEDEFVYVLRGEVVCGTAISK